MLSTRKSTSFGFGVHFVTLLLLRIHTVAAVIYVAMTTVQWQRLLINQS